MNTIHKFDIDLPAEVAEGLEEKVRLGSYASVQDALIEGARALLQNEADIENWLLREVVAGHAEYLADPPSAIPADAVLDRIRARRASAA